jgi:hypothetical protein
LGAAISGSRPAGCCATWKKIPEATIKEAAPAASSLVALTGVGYPEAAQTLKAIAERATRRRRERGVA